MVGAGLAGLSAAYRLTLAGWQVTVLEARERPGGRVWTYAFPGTKLTCEMGGEWVGNSHHRLHGLISELKLPLEKHQHRDWLQQGGKLYAPGEWDYSARGKEAYAQFLKDFNKWTEAQQKNLDRYDWWTWLRKIGMTDEDLRRRDLFDSTDFGESIHTVSAYSAASEYALSDEHNEEDEHVVGGTSELVKALVARLAPDAVRYNAAVVRIEQKQGIVTVATAHESFAADACVYAAPAGTLARVAFDPPLDAMKRFAADTLEYGRIVKTQTLFDERFWPAEDFCMTSDVTGQQYFHTTQGQPGKQGILCSYAIGDKADILAAQDDARKMEIITHDLLPVSARAPELARAVYAKAWQRDAWTQGAYALYKPGQWFTLQPALLAPHGKVLFAGEHLGDWQGFMEAAVQTGEDAAKQLTG